MLNKIKLALLSSMTAATAAVSSNSHALVDPTAAVAEISAGGDVVDAVVLGLLSFAVLFLVGFGIYRKIKNG